MTPDPYPPAPRPAFFGRRLDYWRSLAAAIAAIAALGATIGMSLPLLTLALEARGYSAALIGINTAVQFLGLMLFAPLVPRLMARLGVLATMVGGVVVSALALAAFPFLDMLAVWFVLRLVLGFGEAALFVAGETWINEITSDRMRGRVIGLYGMVLAAGFAVGPLLVDATGIVGNLPFLVAAGLILTALLPLALGRGAVPEIRGRPSQSLNQLIARAPLAAAASLIFGVVDSGALGLLPLWGLGIGFEPGAAARLLTIMVLGGIVLQLPIGWLADLIDRRRLLIWLGIGCTIGFALLPFAAGANPLMYLLLFLVGGFGGALWTASMIYVGAIFRGADLAAVNVAMSLLYGVGSVFGPSLSGWAMAFWPPHGLMAVMAATCALYSLYGLLWPIKPR